MAIFPDKTPPPLADSYTPGTQAWLQPICVAAGDRLYFISQTLTDPNGVGGMDLRPDGTPNQGAGYMPHWVYRPHYPRLQDVRDPPDGAKLYDGINGNAGPGPVIRVDFQFLYCPWAGVVTIEGGRGSVANPTSFPLLIAYGWDQSGRQRQNWAERITDVVRRVVSPLHRTDPIKMPRVPVDMRAYIRHTLTFVNAFNPLDGTALSINRPEMADSVWTPDPQSLILDNGVGTSSCTVPVFGESNRAMLGGFSRVTASGARVPQIIFGIDL
jgi:hypothetical protein